MYLLIWLFKHRYGFMIANKIIISNNYIIKDFCSFSTDQKIYVFNTTISGKTNSKGN